MAYYEIEQSVESTIEVKKSKFYTHLIPYSMFVPELSVMKERYSKANHFVYAYRFLNDFDQVVENQSDDGEPKGSSGKPTLSVLAGKQLINTAAITARVFGGVKLGVGGLVRAYSESVKQSVALSNLINYRKMLEMKLESSYSDLDRLKRILSSFGSEIITTEFQAESVSLVIKIQVDFVSKLNNQVNELMYVRFDSSK
ncbi:MAG: YigZ family protein [Oligoflexales bacterium]